MFVCVCVMCVYVCVHERTIYFHKHIVSFVSIYAFGYVYSRILYCIYMDVGWMCACLI